MTCAADRPAALTVAALAGFLWFSAPNGAPVERTQTALPPPALDSSPAADGSPATVVFAGGCFWGVQAVFEHVKGVIGATAGYSGGSADAATYERVSTGTTGHAESVRVVFDPSVVSFGRLLEVFFSVAHDPTELNRQGPDVGAQYRSAIFFTTDEQKRIARAYIDQLTRTHAFTRPSLTQLVRLDAFYPAEAYHQDYAKRHPDDLYIAVNDLPKLTRLKKAFPALYH